MADVIFLSFQQTPVFWEEEEVSDHVFFFFFNTVLSLLLVLLKQLELHLSGLTYWHICIALCCSYGLWQSLVSVLLPLSERNASEW